MPIENPLRETEKPSMKDNKERIALLVTNEEKQRWQEFAERKGESTLSKMIRSAVDFYIQIYSSIPNFESFSKISHDLKEPLTAIKGYTHILIEKYKENLNSDIIFTLRDILEKSTNLENKITETLEIDARSPIESKYDILIIDDDVSTIKVLTNLLEFKGMKCKGIASGMKIKEEIAIGRPRLILLDIILPEKSGYDICKELKTDPNTKDILVYYITAIPGFEVEKKLEETRADGFFTKPFKFDLIDPLIQKIKKER